MKEIEGFEMDPTPEEQLQAEVLARFLETRSGAVDAETAHVVSLFDTVRERQGNDFARVRGRRVAVETFLRRHRTRVAALRIAAAIIGTAIGLALLWPHADPSEALLAEREARARSAVESLLASRLATYEPGVRASGLASSRYQEIYRSVRTKRYETLETESPAGTSPHHPGEIAPTRIPS
jgi:hypothetical protein